MLLAVKPSFGVEYAVIRYSTWLLLSCVVVHQIAMYVGLPVLHTMLYQRTTEVCLGPQLSRRISHAILRHTWDVSSSRAVVPMHNIHTCIWPVVFNYACKNAQIAYQKDCEVCLEPLLINCILHPPVCKKQSVSCGSKHTSQPLSDMKFCVYLH